MKLLNISLSLVGLMLLAGCTDNNYMELDKSIPLQSELSITASSAELVLQENSASEEAFSLNWTPGTNYGSGNRIAYTLELALSGTDFASATTVIADRTQVYNWTPTVESLNEILINQMGLKAGSSANIQARVTAQVAALEKDQVASTEFAVTTYEPVTKTLYLIGDATPSGWSADHATEMARTSNGIFSWTGYLKPGEVKFITTLGQFLPSYGKAGEDKLAYRYSDDQPDEKFYIEEAHNYKVDVNLLTLTVKFTPVESILPAYEELYFVGSQTGWGFWKMDRDPLDPFLFRIGVFFTAESEFKFGTADGSWENMYKATEPNAPYTSENMEFIKGFEPDNKWFLTSSEANKSYKICVDIRVNAERMIMREFTPYTEMYMIGSATSAGWDLANAVAMRVDPSDPNVFTWTGDLGSGEIKFSADRQGDWNGAWFMADSEGKTPTGTTEKIMFIDKSDAALAEQYKDILIGGVDYKWVISDPGKYTITLNQLYQEITFQKD